MFLKTEENSSCVLMMEVKVILGMFAKVIHVNFEPSFCDHVCEDMIHEGLNSWWSVAKTKEHDGGFIEAKGGDERCLPLILFFDANVVVTPTDIELGEQGRLLHVINQLQNKGKGISVANSVTIEVAVILTGAQHPVLLGYEKEWRGLGRFGGLYPSGL